MKIACLIGFLSIWKSFGDDRIRAQIRSTYFDDNLKKTDQQITTDGKPPVYP